MNQQDYIQAVEEMKIPASKALEWVNIIIKKYYHHYSESDRQTKNAKETFDRIAKASQQLLDMIPHVQEKLGVISIDSADTLGIFTHDLAGPILTMRDYPKILLLLPVWRSEQEQTEDEREHIFYIKKIQSAAEYLSSLDRDVVLKRMLDRIDE
jgi:hypothetical protein